VEARENRIFITILAHRKSDENHYEEWSPPAKNDILGFFNGPNEIPWQYV